MLDALARARRRSSRSAIARDSLVTARTGDFAEASSASYSRRTSGRSSAFSPWSQNAFSIERLCWGIGVWEIS